MRTALEPTALLTARERGRGQAYDLDQGATLGPQSLLPCHYGNTLGNALDITLSLSLVIGVQKLAVHTVANHYGTRLLLVFSIRSNSSSIRSISTFQVRKASLIENPVRVGLVLARLYNFVPSTQRDLRFIFWHIKVILNSLASAYLGKGEDSEDLGHHR